MEVLIVTEDRRLPLILTTLILVNSVLTSPVAKPFSFELFTHPDDFNDTLYEDLNDTKPPVWEQISNDLENLINNTKLEHRQANSVRSANLKEMKDLLRKSSYSIDNKLRIVETTTKRAVNTAKEKILYEGTVMQNKFITKFQTIQLQLKNITESMQISAVKTVNTIRNLIDSGFKTMKDTLNLNFRSLSSLVSQNVTLLTPPPSNESSQPPQHEPETESEVRQSLSKLTALIEGMSLDLWSIKNNIKKAKLTDKVDQNDQEIQTTISPQRTHKTTKISAVTTRKPNLVTKITQKPNTTIATTEQTTSVPNSLIGLFEDSPTVRTEKEDNSFSDLFGLTEKEQMEDNMFDQF